MEENHQTRCYLSRRAGTMPQLTRDEYLALLRVARAQQQHQVYLLIKLFVLTGVPLQCLDQITVELVLDDHSRIYCQNREQPFSCPEGFRQELLDYIAEKNLVKGPVFVTRNGRLIDRSNLCRKLQELCRQAGVPEEKGNPRCLRALYRETKADIEQTMAQICENMYEKLISGEQRFVAWTGE